MSSTDWNRIGKIRVNELDKMSPDDIDILYEIMANVDDIDEVAELEKLRQAFNVSQFIMVNKAEEGRAIGEELDEAKNDIKKLQDVKMELEGENAELQRADGGDINLVREKRNWEMEKEQMEDEIRNLKTDNNSLRADRDLKEVKINDLDQELEQLRDENKKLSSNVEFLRDRANKLKSQKDQTVDTKKSELAYTRSELRQKKIDLDNAEQKMSELYQEIDTLKENLEQGTAEIERMTEEYRSMKRNVEDNNGDLHTRETELKMLKTQIENMKEQLFDKNESDDKIMTYVNDQVEKWKQIMEERDSEILRLYQEIKRLRQELQAAGVNSDKASVQALIKLVKEREEQIKELSSQLVVATKTIDEHSALIENLKKDLDKTGGGTADHQMRRIKELRQICDDKEKKLKEAQERLETVESHAGEREQELTDALERNKMYERGEYGLAEAVGEIKGVKAQLLVKERQNEQLCQEINRINYSQEELRFENGHLRSKLGIDPDEQLDIEGYKRKKATDEEEQRAMNIVLQKEIENLEDERLMLKKKVRNLARQLGIKAGSAGISVDGIMEEDGAGDIEGPIRSQSFIKTYRQPVTANSTWKIQEKEMNKELSKAVQDLEMRDNEKVELQTKYQQLNQEHSAMTEGLKQLKHDLDKRKATSEGMLECPALDKLLVAMETRKMIGDFDTGLYMKTKIDNMEGRNHELRDELRSVRIELEKLRLDYDKTKERALRYEEELKGISGISSLEEHNDDGAYGLPLNMPESTSQTMAALNQHLIIALQEKYLKEEALKKADNALESYRRKFALIRHQQGLLYRQYAEEKKKYESQIKVLETKLKDLEDVRSQDGAKLTEFDNLLINLSQDDSELKRRLSELTRQMTLLRVNEKILCRKFDAVQEMEQTLRRENNKIKNEMIQIEAVVTERMGYYRRFKETANYKLNVLHKELEDSVSRKDLTKLQLKFDELTEKYRSFLEKQNHLISRGESITQLEAELNKLRMDHDSVKKMLELEKQRRHVLEAAFEVVGDESKSVLSSSKSKGSPRKDNKILKDAHLISIAKKVTTLEMKELNERERADHASRMYDNIKNTWNESEKRNKDLEEKLSLLTVSNLELQKIERELRDELIDSVSKEISDQQKQRVLDMEQREMRAKHEIEKLKEISDIATTQVNTLQQQQISREKEMTSLRQQLLDIQAQTDEKSLIGKLHRHIVQLQLSESASLRKLDDVQRGQKRLEAQILKTEQTCDEKDQNLYHTRLEARARTKHLKNTINSLRSQFSGSVSLIKQEKFTRILIKLTEEKVKLDQELQVAIRAKFEAETEMESCVIIKESQEELRMALLNKTAGSNALSQWHKKLEEIRLEEMKQRRLADRFQHEVDHLESVVKCQESQLSQLDEDFLQLLKDSEEKQLQWEQREDELEGRIYGFENIQGDVIVAVRSYQDSCDKTEYMGRIPDAGEPLTNQLEHALTQIRKNVRLLYDKESENKALRKELKDKDAKIREQEKSVLTQERYINEMRLRLPASDNRSEELLSMTNAALDSLRKQDGPDYVDEKTRWAAHTTVTGLKERLKVKDESLLRYEQMLKEAREDLDVSTQKNADEIKSLQDKLKQVRLEKMKEINKKENVENHRRNTDLEDLLAAERSKTQEQFVQISNLKRELESLKLQTDTNNKIYESRLKESNQRNGDDLLNLKEDVNNLKEKLNQKDSQLEYQVKEMESLKEKLSRAPNARLERDVNDLKEQLETKKKQISLMTKNLQELKQNVRDMSKNIPDFVDQQEPSKEENLQKLIDRHTKDLNNQLEGAHDQVLQYQRELRAAKSDRDRLQIELDGLRADSDHNDNLMKKLKSDRKQLEQDNDDLRNQLQRIKNLRSLSTNDATKQQLEETRVRLHLLEEENGRLKKIVDKPEKELNNKSSTWEEDKKNKKMLDKTKDKLLQKTNEVENMKKQLDLTTSAMDRINKEKQVLQNRLTDKWGPGALINMDEDIDKIIPVQSKKVFSAPSKTESLEDLMKKNIELEKEIEKMCNRPNVESAAVNSVALKEAEMRNRLLQSSINDLERRLVQSGNVSGISLEKERALQKENMRLNGENLELRCEVEASRKEIPRLKEKISDLQKYVESVRADKDMEGRTNRSSESNGSTLSNIRKIGESGKSPKELEKTISRMKKVVEKLQRENEMLKEAPGVVMNEQVQFLRNENHNLKEELSQLKDVVGQKLGERYDAKEKGTAKILHDYEKIRKDLNKECEEHEKTNMTLNQMSREVEMLNKENANLKGKLEIAESRNRPRQSNGNLMDENTRLKIAKDQLKSELEDRNRQFDELLRNSEMGRSEDLKNRYRKATEKIKTLEGQLKNLGEQFGVTVKL